MGTLRSGNERVIRQILKTIATRKQFLITSHVRADGDALGAALAVNRMLTKLGKRSHVVCDRGVSSEYAFLPGAGAIGDGPGDLRPPYDTVITVDCGDARRLERVGRALDPRPLTINIDHHASNTRFGDINWIDPAYSSTGEMALDLVRASGVPVDRAIALPVYVAIVTDTGKFSFSNTTERTHGNAAEMILRGVKPAEVNNALYRGKDLRQLRMLSDCIRSLKVSRDGVIAWVTLSRAMFRRNGFEPKETQEFIEMAKSVRGVRVALLFRELADEPGVKVSFRTEEGVDGVVIAGTFGGGGHPRASGCTVHEPLARAIDRVLRRVRGYLKHGR